LEYSPQAVREAVVNSRVVLWLIVIVAGYLLGSLPAAHLAAKWARGIDLRKYGTGNVGVGNLVRTTSWQAGLPVTIFDLGKGMLAVWVTHRLALGVPVEAAAGIASVVGHNWPVFLHFNGGRGILTTMGMFFILPVINGHIPWEMVAFLACAAATFFTIRSTPIGTGAGVAVSPLVSWGTGKPLVMTLGFLAMFLIMVLRRLTAPRSSKAGGISKKQLLLNRFFLDRDIRNGQDWINQPCHRNQITKNNKG
jgi:glycerol-3-phosphate acyltransferase PlsY